MKLFNIIKNFFFCLKYPFYKVYNRFTGKFCGYSYTEYDQLNYGWKKAFGKQMSEEIKKAGKQFRKTQHKYIPWKKMIRFTDIKEKYGTLRLYANCIDDIYNVLTKYELLSECYCMYCGKITKYKTVGWINYLCEDCAKKFYDDLSECELITEDDIPTINRLNSFDKFVKVDLKKEYGIDFKEIWNLKEESK